MTAPNVRTVPCGICGVADLPYDCDNCGLTICAGCLDPLNVHRCKVCSAKSSTPPPVEEAQGTEVVIPTSQERGAAEADKDGGR